VGKQQHISIVYGILLAAAVILSICGLFWLPTDTYTINDKETKSELNPTEVVVQNEDVTDYYFRNVDWEENGSCLHFISSHQDIEVVADGVLLFERGNVETLWGRTPGFAWEYIEIPAGTQEVIVTVTAVYPEVRDQAMTFYQGFSVNMFESIFHEEGVTVVASLLNVCLGFILLFYGIATYRRTSVGKAMVYLGIFTVLLGGWSTLENGIMVILVQSRAICSYMSFTTLAMMGIPFIMFVRLYLRTEDKYVHTILLGLNVINILLTFFLQLFEIADMKQTLWMTHIMMMLSLAYLPFSLVQMIYRHAITRRFWVAICSLVSLFPSLTYSLYMYYRGSHMVSDYGDVFFFVFIAIFAIDVSRSIMKDIDIGKEAAIYRDLAERDMLTGCYNRNAYRNDTSDWKDLQDVLLFVCDLNNLKQCNDTLGHAYGDQYITDAAVILKKIFAPYGKVYRIGGDEFCIVIPEGGKCNVKQMLATLEEEERDYNASSEVIFLQIACGYAVFDPETDSNMEDIRDRADERMYENKKIKKGIK
jgi:diguanylate cyclase (GGDEF)-like protein